MNYLFEFGLAVAYKKWQFETDKSSGKCHDLKGVKLVTTLRLDLIIFVRIRLSMFLRYLESYL